LENKKSKLSDSTKKILGITSVIVFMLLMLAVFYFIGRPLVRYIGDPERFRGWVDSHGLMGRLAFIGVLILQVFFAIIPGEPFEIFAGYAFGIIEGTLLCMLGITLGSILVFLFVRHFGIKAVETFFPREKIDSLKYINNSRKLNTLVFIVFLIPGTPKDLLCYFVGLTRMKLSTWILITTVARIPSIITSTIGGDALGLQNYVFAFIVFAVTFLISGIGLFIYNKMSKKNEDN
jgi:Uncharacterized conserved protein